jgi:hypothetical protein
MTIDRTALRGDGGADRGSADILKRLDARIKILTARVTQRHREGFEELVSDLSADRNLMVDAVLEIERLRNST